MKLKETESCLSLHINGIHKSELASFYIKQEFQIVLSETVSMISNFVEVSLHFLKL